MTEGTPHTPGLRRRLADARAVVTGTKGLRTRIAKNTTAVAGLKAQLADEQQRRVKQDARLKELEAKVKLLDRATTLDTAERQRRDAQFGTLEVRLADLEEHLADWRSSLSGDRSDRVDQPGQPGQHDPRQVAEGRALLEEVRTEHARIRTRMQVVSAYEERLRRVEESVAELYDGDRRHPV